MNSVCADRGSRWFMLLAFARLAALLHELGDDTRPTRLMAGADSRTGISVEVFVEEHQVTPVRVGLELFEISEHWPAALVVLEEDARHAA